jgi:hypothetical protein
MTKTVVAFFDDITVARQVVEDLVNADFVRSSISLITNDAHNQYSQYLDKDYTPRRDAVTASEGAGFGAIVGALTGLLAGLAALTIPGVGILIVAGPIVAGLTGAVAGALTGGITGALIKSGVPEDKAPYYAEGIRRGGTLISVQTYDVLRAENIMNRHGAINIHERFNLWQQTGWKGFGDETIEPGLTTELSTLTPVLTTDKKITQTAPVTQHTLPLTIGLGFEEPQPEVDDTARSSSLKNSVPAPVVETEIADPLAAAPVIVVVDPKDTNKPHDVL